MHLRRVYGRRGVQNKIEISMTPTALLQAASFQHTHEHYDFGEHWQPLLHTLYLVGILAYYKGTKFLKIVSWFYKAGQFSILLEIGWNFQVVFFYYSWVPEQNRTFDFVIDFFRDRRFNEMFVKRTQIDLLKQYQQKHCMRMRAKSCTLDNMSVYNELCFLSPRVPIQRRTKKSLEHLNLQI